MSTDRDNVWSWAEAWPQAADATVRSASAAGGHRLGDDLVRARLLDVLGGVYDIEDELGRGGSAVVYRATTRAEGSPVALKVIRGDQLKDRETVTRFAREAELMQRLQHPHIVGTHAVHPVPPTGIVLALEYMDGGTLKQLVQAQGQLPMARVVALLQQIAAALAAAHEAGVVHRDLKPDNIFLDAANGSAKLGDFGIARAVGSDTLTMTGTVMGTPAYMSPEQIDGKRVDERSDLYSFGLVAWELLTGQQPWAGETLFSVIHKQKTEWLPDPGGSRHEQVPAALAEVVKGCLEKEPDKRLGTAAEIAARLEGLARGPKKASAKPDVVSANDEAQNNPLVASLSEQIEELVLENKRLENEAVVLEAKIEELEEAKLEELKELEGKAARLRRKNKELSEDVNRANDNVRRAREELGKAQAAASIRTLFLVILGAIVLLGGVAWKASAYDAALASQRERDRLQASLKEKTDALNASGTRVAIAGLGDAWVGISVFESGEGSPARHYGDAFVASRVRFMSVALSLFFNPHTNGAVFTLRCTFTLPNGAVAEEEARLSVASGQTRAEWSGGRGWSKPGRWTPGTLGIVCRDQEGHVLARTTAKLVTG